MVKSEFEDDHEKTQVVTTKDLDLLNPRAASRSAYLIVITGRAVGKMFKITSERTVIGRSADNAVFIEDDGISRRHAYIERGVAGHVLVDNASTNGVFVNGERIDRHLLADGDKVQLGSTTILKFSYQDEVEEQFQKALYDSATRDGLTGAFNKKYFADQLKSEFAFSYRHNAPLSLILYDVDHFKKLNDGYGHLAGDYALKTLSGLTMQTLRTEDTFARYGGEEFGVILRQTDGAKAFLIAERIRRTIEAHDFNYEGKRLPVTISLGVATLESQNFPNAKSLVKAADGYLYEAKHKGRNRTESQLMST